VIAAFGELFSKRKLLDPKHHQALITAFDDREVADDEAVAEFDSTDAANRIAEARAFVEAVRGILTSRGLSTEGG
jgi:uncharacterized protein (UPF0332 family)